MIVFSSTFISSPLPAGEVEIVRFNLFWEKISAGHRSAAATDRSVHPDGLGRAAGIGARRS